MVLGGAVKAALKEGNQHLQKSELFRDGGDGAANAESWMTQTLTWLASLLAIAVLICAHHWWTQYLSQSINQSFFMMCFDLAINSFEKIELILVIYCYY